MFKMDIPSPLLSDILKAPFVPFDLGIYRYSYISPSQASYVSVQIKSPSLPSIPNFTGTFEFEVPNIYRISVFQHS